MRIHEKKSNRMFPYFAVASLLLCLSYSCSSRSGPDRAGGTRKTLTFSIPDDVKSMDPATAYDTVAMDVIPLALESLYQYNYDRAPLTLEPLLAESMPTISSNKLELYVKLKKGVFWHDADFFPAGKGRELVAGDFLYAWKRLALPELQSPGTWIFDGKVKGWDAYRKKLRAANAEDREKILEAAVDGLSAPDNYTLKISLLKPNPQLSQLLAMAYTSPLPREVFAKYGVFALNDRVVGTGPYRFQEYVRGSRVVLLKNEKYRGEAGYALPFVEEIQFRIFKEDQPRWLEFTRGNLDVSGIPKDNFSSMVDRGEIRAEQAAKGIQFLKMEQASLYFLLFNMKDALLGKSAPLRKAIVHAFDVDAFVEKFRNGRGVKAVSIVPRTVPGHTARERFPFGFDLDKAKEQLALAGYPGGKGLPPLRLDLRGNSTNNRLQGEFIREALGKIGVNVDVVLNTLPGYLEKERNGNLQFILGVWDSDYPDAENFLALLYGKNTSPGPNISGYHNPAFDRLYEKIALLEQSPERNRLIREAEDLVYKDLPLAPLFYPLAFSVGHGWVKNFRPNIQVTNHMKYFDVDLEKQKTLLKGL